jgi:hypothetical protein
VWLCGALAHGRPHKSYDLTQLWPCLQSTNSALQNYLSKSPPYNGVARAGRPSSLLMVATFTVKSLSLPFGITCKHAYEAKPLRIRTPFGAAALREGSGLTGPLLALLANPSCLRCALNIYKYANCNINRFKVQLMHQYIELFNRAKPPQNPKISYYKPLRLQTI